MLNALRDNHGDLLAALFAVTVVATAWLEVFFPRRPLDIARWRRWLSNLPLGAFNILLFTLAMPLGAFAAALIAEQHGWGALRIMSLPMWLAIPLGILALDLSAYGIHRVLHGVPALWRLHQVHHSDLDVDFTTTVRHHPLEAVFTVPAVFGATIALGISPESVVLYQVLATVLDLTSHGNMRLAKRPDAWLRRVFVTPDMHVVHHSASRHETDSNYGAVFSIWDRLLGSYVAAPGDGLRGVMLGLDYLREPHDQRLDRILLSPLAELPRVDGSRRRAAAVPTD